MTTFESIAMLLGIGCVGFWVIHKRVIPQQASDVFSPLVINIALPSLVFVRIVSRFDPYSYTEWWHMPLWWTGLTVYLGVLAFLGSRISKKKNRVEFGMSLFYQNALFFPLAILGGMFNEDSHYFLDLFFFTIFFATFLFNTNFLFFKKDLKRYKPKRILHPVSVATVLAIGTSYMGLNDYIPEFTIRILRLVGGMTIPLLMIIFGGNLFLDFKKRGTWHIYEVVKFVAIKNFIFPLLTLVIIIYMKPTYNIALLLLLQSAMPPVTILPVITEREGGNVALINQFMLGSFVVSLVSIPLMMSLFSNYFSKP